MAMALDPRFSAKRARADDDQEMRDNNNTSNGNSSANEMLTDDESGRFDDADEEETRSIHSAKRRRSNDWPFSSPGNHSPALSLGRRHNQRRRNLSRSPLRTQVRASTSSSSRDDGPRRSRFVEERMCDSISEKPPSIFTRGENGPNGPRGAGDAKGARSSSGIFRFGKAIAAAFNPFGGWRGSGSMEDGEDTYAEEKRNDDIAQVERAYEELKKAGVKGTAKGGYLQQAAECDGGGGGVDSAVADQTWKTIQEKMESHPVSGRHLSQDSTGSNFSTAATATTPRRDSGTLFRSSLQDLRRAKSSLGIPSIKRNDSGHSHEGPEWSEVKRKKSRKEMHKQAKLIKKVSNLEEKLDRARRELRNFAGDEEIPANSQSQSLCMENKAYPKKFVPGALPTLPSERLLDRQALSASPEPDPAAFTALSPNISRIRETHEETLDDLQVKKQRSTTPKSPGKQDNSLEVPETPPRKRKSPDPASKPTSTNNKPQWTIMPTQSQIPPTTASATSPRKPKHPKTGKTESPELNQSSQSQHNPSSNSDRTARNRNRNRNHKPTPPSPSKRTSISTPRLGMRKGQVDLRSAAANTTNLEYKHDAADHPSRGRRRRPRSPSQEYGCCQDNVGVDDDDIPPVPPIPKDIVAATSTNTAVAVDERQVKMKRKKAGKRGEKRNRKSSCEEEFTWPEDCF